MKLEDWQYIQKLEDENNRLREGKALWSKQANDLEARIEKALWLHECVRDGEGDRCVVCSGRDDVELWPCPTVKALKGEK